VSAAEAREILGRLTLYRFRYRGTDRVRFGYMAQQVQKVAEEVVFEGPDGILRIDYPQLSTLVIAALADTEDGNPQAEDWSCPDAADSER
jgi:hypothetical protein